MSHSSTRKALAAEHTTAAIRRRIAAATKHSYVGDFVLGAMDGAVTTFAVVAGIAGAGIHQNVAIVLGLANLLADGFSMAAGNYLSTKADRHLVEKARRIEEMHIDAHPEGEREEVRQIFAGKGFNGAVLDEIVTVITDDRRRWVDTMITDEHGLALETPHPLRAAATTFAAFALAGLVPLVPYFFATQLKQVSVFGASVLATAVTFFLVGAWKGRVLHRSGWLSGVETLALGGAAALLAYGVGLCLQDLGFV